ncbi:MAG: AzlD domain-containing protein [Chloroflexia bacterium]|nr:AzlD domain-containing protein [Chloroflexia bacterium]
MTAEAVLTIAGMAIATYATRAGGLWLMSRFTPSPAVEAALQALPGTLLVALVAPLALTRGPVETAASALIVLAMLRTGNLIFAIVIGVGTTALLRAVG